MPGILLPRRYVLNSQDPIYMLRYLILTIASYFLLVFVGLRLVVPFMGFRR